MTCNNVNISSDGIGKYYSAPANNQIKRHSQGKAVFYQGFTQFSARNGCLAASDLFHMFTQPIKFYAFHYHVVRVQMFEKGYSSNRQ